MGNPKFRGSENYQFPNNNPSVTSVTKSVANNSQFPKTDDFLVRKNMFSQDNQQPSAADNFHKQAQAYLAQRKLDEAIASCELAIKIDPQYAPAYKTMGNAWQAKGELEEAENYYKQALEVKPDWPEVYANIGSIYAKKKEWQPAIEHFQKAISLKPDFTGAYRNLAKAFEFAGNHRAALESQYRAFSLEPEKVTLEEHLKLGDSLRDQANIELAISCYRNGIKIDNNSAAAYQKLGDALKQQGKLDEATLCYRRAIELNSTNLGDTVSDTLFSSQNLPTTSPQPDAQDTLQASMAGKIIPSNEADAKDTLVASTSVNSIVNSQGNTANNLGVITSSGVITAQDLEDLMELAEAKIAQKKWDEAIKTGWKIIRHKADAKVYKIIGNAQQASGRIDEAIATYTKALEIQPNFPEVYANLGSLYAQKQDWQRGISAYRKAISLKPDFAGAYRNLAKIFQNINRPAEAAECLYESLRKDPARATESQYLEVGNTLMANGKSEQAIACYRAAIKLNPNSFDAIYKLAEFFSSRGQLEEAIPYYQKVVALKPDLAAANQKLAEIYSQLNRTGEAVEYRYQTLLKKPDATAGEYLEVGNGLMENGRLDDAGRCYRAALNLNPNLNAASQKLVAVWQQQGQWDEAISYYRSLIKANPDAAENYQLLADALVEKDELDSAWENYQKAKELDPNNSTTGKKLAEVYYQQAEELWAGEKEDEAIAIYRKAAELNADIDVVYQKLGEILVNREEWEEAVKINQKATELNPDFSWSYNNLGNAFKALEKWEDAVAAYRRAIELNASFEWSPSNLGDCLMELEKWEDAAAAYGQAIELKSDFPWSHLNLGKALWSLGKWQEAIAPYQRALELKEDIPEAYQRLGEALKKRADADLEDAIKWYRKAIENNPENIQLYHKALDIAPEDTNLYLQLGNAYEKQGKGYAAIGFYQAGLQINPDSEEIAAALEKLTGKSTSKNPPQPPVAPPAKGELASGSASRSAQNLERGENLGNLPLLERGENLGNIALLEREEKLIANNLEGGVVTSSYLDSDRYQSWLKANLPNLEQIGHMSETLNTFRQKPTISILMPVGQTSEVFLREAIESVGHQVYPHWELWCIGDNNTTPNIQRILEEYADINSKIKFLSNSETGNLAAGINYALSLATGDYFGLLNSEDVLTQDALYQMAALLNRYPQADMIYSDEDKLTETGKLIAPYFKPNWSPDSFLSRMYTGHFSIYRRDIALDKLNGFRVGFQGSEEYDLILRLSEKTDKIYHVPKVLYHGRAKENGEVQIAAYSQETAKKALEEALDRRGEMGEIETLENHPGFYRVRYQISDYKRVSIIIPTRNLGDILDRCLESIFEKTTYPNYEVIVIDNGSNQVETKAVFEKWKNLESQRFQCHELDIPFNFAKLNNFAAEKANGDFLIFLNNDTEVITADWLEAMVEQAQRPSIGAVGALLLYPDNTIQHAGVVIGLRSVADHSHRGFQPTDAGYHGQIISVNNYSAVTAACLMCRREVFDAVGGFDEDLAVAFNDVDFCLKIVHKGYQNVYLPHAVLYHHESKSRGVEDTGEKQLRFQKELQTMKRRWKHIIEDDPCYNPHLSREKDDFSFRILTDVEARISTYEKDAEIVGFAFDSPKHGTLANVSSVSIGGWVIGKKYPAATVKLSCDSEVLRDVAANLPRQDVAQANLEYPHAQHCGFWAEMEVTEFPPEANILVEAVLKDGSHVRLGMVSLRCPTLIE